MGKDLYPESDGLPPTGRLGPQVWLTVFGGTARLAIGWYNVGGGPFGVDAMLCGRRGNCD